MEQSEDVSDTCALCRDLKPVLAEDEETPDDGEFYCKIRQHQSANECFAQRWWARLKVAARRKSQNLRRLLRDRTYTAAFDCQLQIPGLAEGMNLGVLHTMFAMRCDEENLRYLGLVRATWSNILRNDRQAMLKVDRHTVEVLQHTAPGACARDKTKLYKMIREGLIFPAFTLSEREAIWQEVLAVSASSLIPSLSTFFADLNYLHGPAECIKKLVDPRDKKAKPRTLRDHFTDVGQNTETCLIQVSNSGFVSIPGDAADRLDLGYRQVWLCAMRHYPGIPPKRKQAVTGRLADAAVSDDQTALSELGTLAHRLGFKSNQIRDLVEQPVDRAIARSTLLRARDPQLFRYDDADFERHVDAIVGFFGTATPITAEHAEATPRTSYSDRPPHRCGKPRKEDHDAERSSLFVRELHEDGGERLVGITPFFIRRSVYWAFFGRRNVMNANESTVGQESWQRKRQKTGREKQEREKQEREKQEREKQERKSRARAEQKRQAQTREKQEREKQEDISSLRDVSGWRQEREGTERKTLKKSHTQPDGVASTHGKRHTQIDTTQFTQISGSQGPKLITDEAQGLKASTSSITDVEVSSPSPHRRCSHSLTFSRWLAYPSKKIITYRAFTSKCSTAKNGALTSACL
jgi:hypothetical protein